MNARKNFILFLFIFTIACKGQIITSIPSPITDKDYRFSGVVYSGASVFFTAINIPTTYFNIKKLHKHDKYRENAVFGTLSGITQTALGIGGIAILSKNELPKYCYIPAVINIGLGLATTATSIIRLATKNPPKENGMTINMFCFPNPSQNAVAVGFNFSKSF